MNKLVIALIACLVVVVVAAQLAQANAGEASSVEVRPPRRIYKGISLRVGNSAMKTNIMIPNKKNIPLMKGDKRKLCDVPTVTNEAQCHECCNQLSGIGKYERKSYSFKHVCTCTYRTGANLEPDQEDDNDEDQDDEV